jgi:hypothetical protein
MLNKKLVAGALLACANMAWGATCNTSATDLGTLWPSTSSFSQSALFGASCSAAPDADPNDPSAWSFTNTHRFTLAGAATAVFGGIDLNFTRTGQVDPNSPTKGDPYYMITTSFIEFVRNGVSVFAGTEGAGHHEHANLLAFDLEAGDYLMVIHGNVFNTPTRSGWYNGSLNVSYANSSVAAPVPEPETAALLLLGIPLVGFVSRRKQRARASA